MFQELYDSDLDDICSTPFDELASRLTWAARRFEIDESLTAIAFAAIPQWRIPT